MYKQVEEEFYRVLDSDMSIRQKNVKYATLMSSLERIYHIPALAENASNVEPCVMELYKMISYARNFGGANNEQ